MNGPFGNAHGQLFDAQCGGLGSVWRRAALEESSGRAHLPEGEASTPKARRRHGFGWAVGALVLVLLAGALPLWLNVALADEPLLDSAVQAVPQRV